MADAAIARVRATPLAARFADLFNGDVPSWMSRPASQFTDFPRLGQYLTLVEITDGDGLTGYGEAWGLPLPEAAALWIDRVIAPWLVGRPAADIASIHAALLGNFARLGHGSSIAMEALSGIDIALWDLKARRQGISLAELLGGGPPRIPCYVSPVQFADTEAESRAAARRFADQGFRAIKVKVGRGVARDLADARAIRDEVGADIDLLFDANGAYPLPDALALGEGLATVGAHWLEEPLLPDHVDQLPALRRAIPVPIAVGENDFALSQFRHLIDAGGVDVVMPNITRAGGITGCRAIADLADRHGVDFSLHGVGGDIMIRASLALLASRARPELFEVNRFPNPLRHALMPAVDPIDGAMPVPQGAGLGGVPDGDAIARFATGT